MIPSEKGCWVRYVDIERTRKADAKVSEEYAATILQLQDKINDLNKKIENREALIVLLEYDIASYQKDL